MSLNEAVLFDITVLLIIAGVAIIVIGLAVLAHDRGRRTILHKAQTEWNRQREREKIRE